MKKIIDKLPIIKAWRDIANYRSWIKTIKGEKNLANSFYTKNSIKHNVFYNLYLGVTLPDEDKNLPDNIKQLRVFEILAPAHRYIDEDLGFAGYIVPEFNQVYDDEGDPTLTYIVVYRFAFDTISFKFILIRLLLIGALIALPWAKLISWISTLI